MAAVVRSRRRILTCRRAEARSDRFATPRAAIPEGETHRACLPAAPGASCDAGDKSAPTAAHSPSAGRNLADHPHSSAPSLHGDGQRRSPRDGARSPLVRDVGGVHDRAYYQAWRGLRARPARPLHLLDVPAPQLRSHESALDAGQPAGELRPLPHQHDGVQRAGTPDRRGGSANGRPHVAHSNFGSCNCGDVLYCRLAVVYKRESRTLYGATSISLNEGLVRRPRSKWLQSSSRDGDAPD